MGNEQTATRARVRNRRGQGGRLREDIVNAAVELLDETGDENAITLRSVARRVGIAAPSIYPHFSDQPAIMLAVLRHAFAELDEILCRATNTAGDNARERLLAICDSYLDFAKTHTGRYRAMFGGLWNPDLNESSVAEQDLATLGQTSMRTLSAALADCVTAGQSTSTEPETDAVALWLGLHGLAHQRVVAPAFRWPPDIANRLVSTLAHLTEE